MERFKLDDKYFMEQAYMQALKAFNADETPIGCIIEYNGIIIGRGYNLRNTVKNPLHHAEIIAINEAAVYIGDWRLEDTSLYVTVEPCPMCAGAILQARISRVVFGAFNPKAGCAGSVFNLLNHSGFNHQVEVVSGVMEEESAGLMKNFFKKLREE